MNLISYFYNFFRIVEMFFASFKGPNIYDDDSDIEYEPIQDNNETLQVEEPPAPLRRRTNRRCGYCRGQGHNVTDCDNVDIILNSNVLHGLINNSNTTRNDVRVWISNKSEALIKVILCQMRLIRYTSTLSHTEFDDIIMDHINEIRGGNVALQNVINNVIEYRGELQLPSFEISDEGMYDKLSITTSIVTNNSEDIICPICFENVEHEKICKTNCNHEFCKDCMNQSLRDNIIIKNESGCPLCRSRITHLYLSATN